jgi:hypothetical protein
MIIIYRKVVEITLNDLLDAKDQVLLVAIRSNIRFDFRELLLKTFWTSASFHPPEPDPLLSVQRFSPYVQETQERKRGHLKTLALVTYSDCFAALKRLSFVFIHGDCSA